MLEKPVVKTPSYWISSLERIEKYLKGNVKKGQLVQVGMSAGSRRIAAVTYTPGEYSQTLAIIGGTHGHEPECPAACMNMLNLLEEGKDLKGGRWPDFRELVGSLRLIIIPVINPDARHRCLENYTRFTIEEMQQYQLGVWSDSGETVRDGLSFPNFKLSDKNEALDRLLFLGGRYNDAGFLINRPKSVKWSNAIEVMQTVEFLRREKPDCIIDLHSHQGHLQFLSSMKEEHIQRTIDINNNIVKRAGEEGYMFYPLANRVKQGGDIFNIDLFAEQTGALSLILESDAGHILTHLMVGSPVPYVPEYNQARLLNNYIFTVQELIRIGVTEGFLRP